MGLLKLKKHLLLDRYNGGIFRQYLKNLMYLKQIVLPVS